MIEDNPNMIAAATMACFGFFMMFIGACMVWNFGIAMVLGGALILTVVILAVTRET